MISALILTYNEENIIGKCLKALSFVDEIVVLDSFSNDTTVEIAEALGARVIRRKFDNYANQRNEGLKSVSPLADWILMVDADEIVSNELKEEVIACASIENNPITLYHVRRKDMFQGKWIRYSSGYPTWFGRFFKNGQVWVEREVNEEYHTSGAEGYLKQHLIHYPFNKGLEWWFEKHNKYSSMEARFYQKEMGSALVWKDLFTFNPLRRRKALKQLSYRLPFRPFIVFMAFYILKRGFLDGRRGYTFCKLRKTYEWMIDLKIRELKHP